MKAFFDTNILIDVFSHRDEESRFSQYCYELVAAQKIVGYINAKQLTDFYYILYKNTHDKKYCDESIKILCEIFEVVQFDKFNIINSIKRDFTDFEDGTVDDSAKLYCCDALITRNTKHFKNAKCIVYTPKQFITLFETIENK